MRLQSGQALLELLLTLAISALLSVWAVQRWQAHLREQQLQNWAGWLLEVRQGVQRYMDAHASDLLAGAAALPGYADPWRPGMAELAAQGWLPRGLSSMPLNWPGLQIQLTPQGDCPGACRLDALLLLFASQDWAHRPAALGQWLLETRGYGLVVHPDRSTRLQGPAGDWPNPLSGTQPWPAGTMAVLASGGRDAGLAGEDMSSYLRLRDERDPDFQANLSARGQVQAHGNLQTQGALVLGGSAYTYSACSQEAAIVRRIESPGLLTCRQGYWRPLASAGGGAFMTHSHTPCPAQHAQVQVNPMTGQCSCPSGYLPLRIAEYTVASGVTRSYLCVD
ncbi:MAG: hypothetical protein ACN6OC_03115 [Alcaligenes sp.]